MDAANVCAALLLQFVLISAGRPSDDVCTSPGCRKASSDVLGLIDPAFDPCEDFYRFACGGTFKKTFEAKPASLDALTRKEVDDQTSLMIIKPVDPSEPTAVQAMKKFFRSCMDEAAIEKYGLNSLKRALHLLGGWPAVEQEAWDEEEFGLEELLVKLRKMGYNFGQLVSIRTVTDKAGLSVVIEEPSVEKVQARFKENYHDYMVNISVLLGADRKTASFELQEMLLFKMKLTEVFEKQDRYNKSTVREVQEQFQFVDWMYLVENIINDGRKIVEEDEVFIPIGDYFAKLNEIIKTTSNRTLANYIIWEAIEEMIWYLPKEFREAAVFYIDSNSRTESESVEEQRSRLEFCKNQTSRVLKPTFEALYVKEYFSYGKRRPVEDIVAATVDQLEKTIDAVDFDAKKELSESAESLSYSIGGPEDVFDELLLAQLVSEDESVNSNDLLTIASTLKKHQVDHAIRLGLAYDYYDDFYDETVRAEAFYDPRLNSIVIPAGLLQNLYFDENRPQYLNFGTIASTVAYELSRGFPVQGGDIYRQYTSNFEVRKRLECLKQQASEFSLENSNLHMNGTKVQRETFYDVLSVDLAYNAYKTWQQRHGPEKELPGLGYTDRQLFWISAASRFCDSVPLDDLKEFLDGSRRGHPNFRVFAAFSNNEHFGKDFNCPSGSTFNPSNKCQLFRG